MDRVPSQFSLVAILISTICPMSGCQDLDNEFLDRSGADPRKIDSSAWVVQAETISVTGASGNVQMSATLARQTLAVDQSAEVSIELDIEPGFHLYGDVSTPGPFTALRVQATVNDSSVTVQPTLLPRANAVVDGKPAYRESAKVFVPLKLSEQTQPGNIPVTLQIQYQVCNDLICMPPENISLDLVILLTQSPEIFER